MLEINIKINYNKLIKINFLRGDIVEKNRLKILRQKHGLSQKELADAVGMKQPMINRIEAGNSSLTMANAIKIASILNEPFSELFEDIKEMESKNKNIGYDFLGMLQDWQLKELQDAIKWELRMRKTKREEM